MSLDKAIKHGKEHRKSFEGTNKQYCASCRNHGNCSFCKGNRLHKFRDRHPQTLEEAIEETTDILEQACPVCENHLYKVTFKDSCQIYICAYCGHVLGVLSDDNFS